MSGKAVPFGIASKKGGVAIKGGGKGKAFPLIGRRSRKPPATYFSAD
jgi:hypothetical protein